MRNRVHTPKKDLNSTEGVMNEKKNVEIKKKVYAKHINLHAVTPPFRYSPLHPPQTVAVFRSDE